MAYQKIEVKSQSPVFTLHQVINYLILISLSEPKLLFLIPFLLTLELKRATYRQKLFLMNFYAFFVVSFCN